MRKLVILMVLISVNVCAFAIPIETVNPSLDFTPLGNYNLGLNEVNLNAFSMETSSFYGNGNYYYNVDSFSDAREEDRNTVDALETATWVFCGLAFISLISGAIVYGKDKNAGKGLLIGAGCLYLLAGIIGTYSFFKKIDHYSRYSTSYIEPANGLKFRNQLCTFNPSRYHKKRKQKLYNFKLNVYQRSF